MLYGKSEETKSEMEQNSVNLQEWKVRSSSFIGDISSHMINVNGDVTQGHICERRKAKSDDAGNCGGELKWILIILPLTCIAIWAMAFALFGNLAFPGGSLFALLVLQLISTLFGQVAEHFYLPPAFGMILGGILLRNVPPLNSIGMDLDPNVTNPLRAMSVVVLLTRGAFAVNLDQIIKSKMRIPSLYIGACVAEACAAATAAYFLTGFPIPFCAAMGCIYSAMSGGIVMPYLSAIDRNVFRGERNSTMTLAKDACGLDAILAIAMTEVAFGFIFANDGNYTTGLRTGAAEVVFGFVFGITWGAVAGFGFKHVQSCSLKTFIIFAGGSISLLGLTRIGHPRGGPIGCYFGAFVAASIWRHKKEKSSLDFNTLWYFFHPLLFGIIGSRLNLSNINWDTIGAAMICLIISISVRTCTVILLLNVTSSDMITQEKLFLAIAWLPKGTVQAALGPVALETATAMGVDLGSLPYDLLTISAMVIIFGTLLGPLCLLAFGPKLLKSKNNENICNT